MLIVRLCNIFRLVNIIGKMASIFHSVIHPKPKLLIRLL